jgi:hypothetical protein
VRDRATTSAKAVACPKHSVHFKDDVSQGKRKRNNNHKDRYQQGSFIQALEHGYLATCNKLGGHSASLSGFGLFTI